MALRDNAFGFCLLSQSRKGRKERRMMGYEMWDMEVPAVHHISLGVLGVLARRKPFSRRASRSKNLTENQSSHAQQDKELIPVGNPGDAGVGVLAVMVDETGQQ
jgi:hypothetical protein